MTIKILDDDPPSELSVADASVNEGGTLEFEVTLTPVSGRDVTVGYTLGGPDDTATRGTDYEVPSDASVEFPAGETSATIMVETLDDGIVEPDETLTLTLSNAINADLGTSSSAVGTVISPGVIFEPSVLEVTEGGSATFTQVLKTQPTDTVFLFPPAAGDLPDGLSLNPSAFSGHSTTSWDLVRTVTVTAADDGNLDSEDRTETISYRVEGALEYLQLSLVELTVIVLDNDDPPELSLSVGSAVIEGDSLVYTVTLAPVSGKDVTVSYSATGGTATAGTDYTAPASGASVTIPAGETTATIEVPTLADGSTGESTETVTLTLSSPVNATIDTASATGSITNSLEADLVITPNPLAVDEGDTAEYEIRLSARQSSGNVDVTLTVPAGLTVDDSSLRFTRSNWNDEQTVTVTATDNSAYTGGVTAYTIGHSASGTDYAGVTRDLTVNVTDDEELPEVSVTALTGAEEDAEFVRIELSHASPVVVTVDVDLVATPPTLIPAGAVAASAGEDYTDLPKQTVEFAIGVTRVTTQFRIVDDALLEHDEVFDVLLGDVSAGATIVTGDEVLTVTIVSDDAVPTFTISDVEVAEGQHFTGTVTISPVAGRDVEVSVHSEKRTGDTATSPADYEALSEVVHIAAGATSGSTSPKLTVDDDIDEGAFETTSLVLQIVPGGVTIPPTSSTLTIRDDDTAGLAFSRVIVPVDEDGSATYTVALTSEPTDDVVITLSGHAGTDVTLSGSTLVSNTLTFTDANWGTVQTVTVSAADDDDFDNERVTIEHDVSSDDDIYDDLTPVNVRVDVSDDDAGVTVETTALTVDEGGATASYRLRLKSQPTADVSIVPTSSYLTGLWIDGDLFKVFTSGNWNSWKTFRVRAIEDDNAVHETVTVSHTVTSADTDYAGVDVDDVTVTINDNDMKGVTLSQYTIEVREGRSVTYTARLDSRPTATVTVTPSLTSAGSRVTVTPASYNIDPGRWRTNYIFTITAGEDGDENDESVAILHDVSGGDYDGVNVIGLAVTVVDNDREGVTVEPTELTIGEGESGSYTVVLRSEPTAAVTVTPASSSKLSVSPVTFQPAQWDQPKTITVTANQDGGRDDDTATITHSVSSSDVNYDGVVVEDDVVVNIVDDDKTVPDAPRDLTALVGDGQVTLTWAAPLDDGGHPISDYQVKVDSGGWTSTGGTATRWTVRGLFNGETYTFEVRARNTLGAGDPAGPLSASLVGVTIEDDVRVDEAAGFAAFTVKLSPPSEAEVTVSYITYGSPATEGSDYTAPPLGSRLTFAPGETTKTISIAVRDDSVAEAEEYFTVALRNPTGALLGRDQARAYIVDDDPPAKVALVEAIAGNAEIDVRWTPVEFATGYKVQWKSGTQSFSGAAGSGREAAVGAADDSDEHVAHVIAGLRNGTAYTIRVIATRAGIGDGTPSNEVTATPDGSLDVVGDGTGTNGSITAPTEMGDFTTINGRIDFRNDIDWYRVEFRRNTCYQIDIRGVDDWDRHLEGFVDEEYAPTQVLTLDDPMLRGVYDAGGVYQEGTEEEYGGWGLSVIKTVRARSAGTYYIAVTHAWYPGPGTYDLSVTNLGPTTQTCTNIG